MTISQERVEGWGAIFDADYDFVAAHARWSRWFRHAGFRDFAWHDETHRLALRWGIDEHLRCHGNLFTPLIVAFFWTGAAAGTVMSESNLRNGRFMKLSDGICAPFPDVRPLEAGAKKCEPPGHDSWGKVERARERAD